MKERVELEDLLALGVVLAATGLLLGGFAWFLEKIA